MLRTFQTHCVRPQSELSDCLWQFAPCTADKTPTAAFAPVFVPGCWETLPGLRSYRGFGLYRRSFTAEGTVRLVFKGVSHTADVYVDGVHVAHHYNAYTAFEAIIEDLPQGEHTLEVLVDNRFTPDSALHLPNDYMTYGGIIRPVALEQLGAAWLRWAHYTPRCTGGVWTLDAAVCVCAQRDFAGGALRLECAGAGCEVTVPALRAGQEITVSASLAVGVTKPWAPETPELYLAQAQLWQNGAAVDDLIERVGFRQVVVSGKRILLNGRAVRIKGFCRHEEHPHFGCALPVQMMQQDIAQLRDLGANSVRTVHYPNDERFLDLCDEQGILVWEENHARGLVEKDMRNPNFEPQCEACNAEMLRDHYNHPSIYIWGILNECASETEYGRTCYKAQLEQLRALDQSRPLTFATCRFAHNDGQNVKLQDICMDLPDVVSINIYPLWYFDCDVSDFLGQLYAEVQRTAGAGKPMLISEVGAGAIYGCHAEPGSGEKWSEEYQAEALERQLAAVLGSADISGAYIWQFCDVRVSREWFASRPRSFNNKGVVDEYRRPKLAYAAVKKLYTALGNYRDRY